jgi:tetratricopeptide (TPR) repeat protein
MHWDLPRATEYLDALIEQVSLNPEAELSLFHSAKAILLWQMVNCLCFMGRVSDAEAAQRELERVGRGSGPAPTLDTVAYGAAALAVERGDVAASLQLLVPAYEGLAEDSAPVAGFLFSSQLSQAHELAGDHPAALEAAEKALAIIRGQRAVVAFEASSLSLVAGQRARCGDPEGGLALAEEGLSLARKRGSRYSEGHARCARALCLLLARGAVGAAEIEAELDRATEVVESNRQRGLAARLLELRAELAEALGDSKERRRWLDEAESAYREMGATGHAERLAEEFGL